MTRRQRILAEKRINDVIFEIEMGELQQATNGNTFNNLTANSVFQSPYMSALNNNNINYVVIYITRKLPTKVFLFVSNIQELLHGLILLDLGFLGL